MNCKKMVYRIFSCLLIAVSLCSGAQTTDKIFASELNFYNHNTDKNVNYTGKQVSYIYNNKRVALTYPGIIIDDIALADYKELFVNELGLFATVSDNNIIFIDGETELVLTLDSKTAKLNGISKQMSVAPIKLAFSDGTVKYYVPTRFVAENLGYNYVWNSQTCEVKITKTLHLSINEKTVLYNNTLYSVLYKEEPISFNLPVISYRNTVYAPAEFLFEALGCQYQEEAENISVAKDAITIQMQMNSLKWSINDRSFSMNDAPIRVSVENNPESYTYVPLENTLTWLGFNVSDNPEESSYIITDTEYTGNPELHPNLKEEPVTKILVDQEPLTTYFVWSAENISDIDGVKNLTEVRAYSIENADVIELYGISKDNVNDVMDNNFIIFELKSVISDMDIQFYSDFEVPHLQYALLAKISDSLTKLVVMLPMEDTWLFEETEECLKIYFTTADYTLEDLKVYAEAPNVHYLENRLVIPVPEGFNTELVEVCDNYLDKNIQIMLPGNLVDYYKNTQLVNPYDFINDIDIIYDDAAQKTIITIFTAYICGFEEYYGDTFFSVYLDRPTNIYDKIIVLDAGHGGKDPGAERENIYEKNINLSIINYTEELFKNSDIKVYCTRIDDTYLTLQERVDFVQEVCADMFVSLHINANVTTSVYGTEVYYCSENNNALENGLTSKKLAQALANKVYAAMDTKLRGVINNDYFVIKNNSVPAVLIELGFISNKTEREKLINKTYQQKSAQAIFESIVEIFSAYPTGR